MFWELWSLTDGNRLDRRAKGLWLRFRRRLSMFIVLFLMILTLPNLTHAQSCNPASVNYMIRDEQGRVLSDTELKTLEEQLPKAIGDANLYVTEVSLADDQKSYYWPESVDFDKGKKQPALGFANAGTCTMHLTEVTLKYHNLKMHLIFNIDIDRTQPDRRMVIDSLPFQEGTFSLDMSGRGSDNHTIVPAQWWKKLK
jgi:hypothetical protein